MPSSQRPFFLSSFLAAFRPRQTAPSLSAATAASSQANKHHSQSNSSTSPSSAGSRSLSTSSAAAQTSSSSSSSSAPPQSTSQQQTSQQRPGQLPLHQPRTHGGIPIPAAGGGGGRRRGSDSSSEGFRDVLGGEKWYIGGRTAAGEERFFKLGVVRRVRSQDRLSLDRLSL